MTITTTTEPDTLRLRARAELAVRLPDHVERLRWDADRLAFHQRARIRALLYGAYDDPAATRRPRC